MKECFLLCTNFWNCIINDNTYSDCALISEGILNYVLEIQSSSDQDCIQKFRNYFFFSVGVWMETFAVIQTNIPSVRLSLCVIHVTVVTAMNSHDTSRGFFRKLRRVYLSVVRTLRHGASFIDDETRYMKHYTSVKISPNVLSCTRHHGLSELHSRRRRRFDNAHYLLFALTLLRRWSACFCFFRVCTSNESMQMFTCSYQEAPLILLWWYNT